MYTSAATAAALLAAAGALAAPAPGVQKRSSINLPLKTPKVARQYAYEDSDARLAFLEGESIRFRNKYKGELSDHAVNRLKRDVEARDARLRKRQDSGSVSLIDTDFDASYSSVVEIGTPAQSFNVIMDTGSSDLWVVDSVCKECTGLTTYQVGESSTLKETSSPFNVSYGSGDVNGVIATETVSMAGFTTTEQYFGLVEETISTDSTSGSTTLLDAPLSGIMGLAWLFLSVAAPTTVPWWQRLAESTWTDKRFAFFMKRFRWDNNATRVEEDGGEVVFGGVNSSMYTGDINYIDIAKSDQDYWRIPVDAVTVNGKNMDYSTSASSAVIDTGTTMIAGPPTLVAKVYSSIPKARAISNMQGYYAYPCSTNIEFTMTFGGVTYTVDNEDFNMGPIDTAGTYCLGSLFDFEPRLTSPVRWIVGAAFLKNVYSIYRYDPSAVGFAQLAPGVQLTGVLTGTSGGTANTATATKTSPGSGITPGSSTTTGSGSNGNGNGSGTGNTNQTSSNAAAPSAGARVVVGLGVASLVALAMI